MFLEVFQVSKEFMFNVGKVSSYPAPASTESLSSSSFGRTTEVFSRSEQTPAAHSICSWNWSWCYPKRYLFAFKKRPALLIASNTVINH